MNHWRSLEELAATEHFQEFLHREFPDQASEWEDEPSRRKFFKLMGASLALAGLTACTRQPTETIMPYVRAPEEIIPGRPLFYATAVSIGSVGQGVLVKCNEGRPIKVEGNPDHPASLGATDVLSQASVLSLYDPDRAQNITFVNEVRTWGAFSITMRRALDAQRGKGGAGLRILSETVMSPTLGAQMNELLRQFPAAKWHQYEPAGPHSARSGAQLIFGRALNTYYKLDGAGVILSLDADFLTCGPAGTRCAHDFANGRRVRGDRTDMNRLYVVESTPSATGGRADHRLPLRAADIELFAWQLARAFLSRDSHGAVAGLGVNTPAPVTGGIAAPQPWMEALTRDLQAHRGACAIIPGEQQSPAVHALTHAMNDALGNTGKTVIHTDSLEVNPVDQFASLRELVQDMESGSVELLLILGGNPVYNAPADLGFREKIAKVPLRVRLGQHDDETSRFCDWHVPQTHEFETWSDTRAFDGTVTIMQPLIAPLYSGRSAHEMLALFIGGVERPSYDIVREYWSSQKPADDFEAWWSKSVHDGLVAGSALPAVTASLRSDWSAGAAPRQPPQGLEIVFRPDPYLYDGRFANNGWLQELPRPMTKLTWDNAALVSPATAARLQLENERIVELLYQGRSTHAAVWISPGHANDAITVHLGYGRTRAGKTGSGFGFDAYAIRTSGAPWIGTGLEIRKTRQRGKLASVQTHYNMEGRDLVESATIDHYKKDPAFAQEKAKEPPNPLTLYPPWQYPAPSWGMAIDLTACVNCNACVVACQAENNIPVVGKDEVMKHRAMHWLRVDTYFEGGPENPAMHYQPVPCMHCENAPCELVCPVQATNHTGDGLNAMVYNRCVGTRYCSNNCPYKVRRFNFFLYADWYTPSLKLQRNPDVTVRSRGVMEKCTYCIQRINAARIDAEKENRPIRDGEIETACQQACPTQAIIFGDINDPDSRVAKMKAEKLNYALLGELNTRPRTTYLAELRNPNPELV